MLHIRKATHGDLGRITEIYNHAVLHTTATFDTEPKTSADQEAWLRAHCDPFAVMVAELDGQIVGWGSLGKWSDRGAYAETAEISLYVDRGHQGKGIGTEMLESLIRAARRNGFHTVVSRIVEGNAASIHMHERLGFRQVGVMREVGRKFGKRLDVHLLQMVFSGP